MRLLYNYDADVIADMKAEVEEEAEKILSQITPDMSDYEIVKLNKEIADLKAKLQKYEDKQSAKQDASKQNSTKKSFFGRKK